MRRVSNNRAGPVLAIVEYRAVCANRIAILGGRGDGSWDTLCKRDVGPMSGVIYEDVNDNERFTESFMIESWLEVLHERERRTKSG